jgi:hypothetical protein
MTNMREFHADGSNVLKVFVFGVNRADDIVSAYMADTPNVEVNGHVECVMRDNNGHAMCFFDGHEVELMTYTLHGRIRWEHVS